VVAGRAGYQKGKPTLSLSNARGADTGKKGQHKTRLGVKEEDTPNSPSKRTK